MELAIRGHYTRGEEVIKILEMLGGRNVDNLDGNAIYYYYTIMNDKKIIGAAFYLKALDDKFYILSLEEFLEKFPYKVGDKVHNIIHNENQIITDLAWDSKENEVVYQTNNNEYVFVNYLRPYKEETMNRKYNVEEYLKVWDAAEKGLEVFVNDNFELKEDNGKFYIVKKQPHYPKTYKECCEVLMGKTNFQDFGLVLTKFSTTRYEEDAISPEPPHITLINNFYKLLICRDAYWKIAGDWKPDWNNKQSKSCIAICENQILRSEYIYANIILAFPTAEMRDAFFENFKDLIEQCKELL